MFIRRERDSWKVEVDRWRCFEGKENLEIGDIFK